MEELKNIKGPYDEHIKLFKEAYKLGATELFNKVYKYAYNKGYEDAVKRFDNK